MRGRYKNNLAVGEKAIVLVCLDTGSSEVAAGRSCRFSRQHHRHNRIHVHSDICTTISIKGRRQMGV